MNLTRKISSETGKKVERMKLKRSTSRGVEKTIRFYNLHKINSSLKKNHAFKKNHVSSEHSYVRKKSSNRRDESSRKLTNLSGTNDVSSMTGTIFYDPRNIYRKATKDRRIRENENSVKIQQRESKNNRTGRKRTEKNVTLRRKKIGGKNGKILRKNITRERRCRKATNEDGRGKIVSRTKRENKRNFIETFNQKDSIEGNNAISRINRKTTSPKIIKKNNEENERIESNIDFDDSEFDESLLVDPSTDLPRSLLETIDDKIQLAKPEFDLNFESDESLALTFESFEREFFSNSDYIDVSTETSKNTNANEELAKNNRLGTSGSLKNGEIAGKKRRRSADEIVTTRMPDLRANHRDNVEKMMSERRERSTDGAAIDIAERASSRERRKRVENKSPTERRRASADSMITNGMENTNVESFERVTRSSMQSLTMKKTLENRKIGTLIWGNCMGWWPGIIVDSEDVGMLSFPEKSWVCWIGEYKITNLRDKTQIQPFSASFHERMIEILKRNNLRDQNYRACTETIELINDYILKIGPLKKPPDVWATKHLSSLKNLDRLILHPYPPEVKLRLDDLKSINYRATERYLSEMKANAEKSSSTRSANANKITTLKNTFVPVEGHLPLMKQEPGVIAWAKIMGQPWWPAVIVDYRDWGMKEPSFGCQWIVWYGDNTMSQVNHRFFLSFENGMRMMREYARNCRRECYRRGVIDAARDYCSRYGYKTDDWRMEDAFSWFETKDDENSSTEKSALPGIPGNYESIQKYPPCMVQALRKHRGSCTVAAAREHAIEDSESMSLVKSGGMKMDRLCLMCLNDRRDDEKTIEHPFFVGKLCDECTEKYKPTIFAYGDDGKCFFCTICAGSDTVVMCDEDDCPRVYCTACMKYLLAPSSYDEILLKDPWLCFVCDKTNDCIADGLLKPRSDWKERVYRLFRTNRESVPGQLELYRTSEKRKIRVLSLFDGISAGLVVLKKLGIRIEIYYASEIDPDAEMISSAHHGGEIVKRIGDVRTITDDKLRDIMPIDLLIGGSPCNDLSLVNPLRLGLHDPNGTGILVFEYCRVKNMLEMQNGRHFFWMFENVASMPSKYRIEINEHLGREPELIDSANYSPQHRPRLYWSNLPIVSFPLSTQDLQDVLTPNCNRRALVKKIRTVTTRVNSLKQGRDALKPILMNETNDTLWITELEEIFGFPKHYTDVKNLCATKRQKLIAMSWSVQTIMEIMRPLCNFFDTRDEESY